MKIEHIYSILCINAGHAIIQFAIVEEKQNAPWAELVVPGRQLSLNFHLKVTFENMAYGEGIKTMKKKAYVKIIAQKGVNYY